MTTTVNTDNSVSISNPLIAQKITPGEEEFIPNQEISAIALRTIQQLSGKIDQLSMKLSLVLKNQDQLTEEIKKLHKQPIISLCPPLPPPPPSFSKINLKDQENDKASIKQKESAPSNSTNCVDKLETPNNNSPGIPNVQMKDHIEKMRLKWAAESNKTTTNSTSQNNTTPTLATELTPKNGINLHRSKSLYVKSNKEKEKKPK